MFSLFRNSRQWRERGFPLDRGHVYFSTDLRFMARRAGLLGLSIDVFAASGTGALDRGWMPLGRVGSWSAAVALTQVRLSAGREETRLQKLAARPGPDPVRAEPTVTQLVDLTDPRQVDV